MRVQNLCILHFCLCHCLIRIMAGNINIGILHSAHSSWIEIMKNNGYRNDSLTINSILINETEWWALQDLSSAKIQLENLAGIVGHYNKVVAAVSEHLKIPYFVTSMVPHETDTSQYTLNMIPDATTYTAAIKDLFQHYKWTQSGIIYDNDAASNIAARLSRHIHGEKDVYDIRAYNIQHNTSADVVRWALKELREKEFTNFLVICTPEATSMVLTQALYLSLLSRPNNWLVVNLGYEDIDMSPFVDSKANLTLLRLMVDPYSGDCALNESNISLSKAIHHDILRLILNKTVSDNSSDNRVSRKNVRKSVKEADMNACTGHLKFSNGLRNETFLQMLVLQGIVSGAGFNQVWSHLHNRSGDYKAWLIRLSGTWRSGKKSLHERVQPSMTYSKMLQDKDDIFGDKILRVTTLFEPPFVQPKNKTEEGKNGNERYEGFCIDILEELAKLLGFKYNITLVHDKKYGSWKTTGWTGIIGELIKNKVDIGLAPFSITPNRSEVVDFTKPFMTKGTSVVVKKPERVVWPFQFLSPLSRVVWIAIFVSFLFVGLFLFGVSRINSDRKEDFSHNLRDSFWYVWGTLLRADLNVSPRATSGRIVSCTWWFFSLIVISVYTANLAAFLTITNAHIPIDSAADLAYQTEYDYGTVDGSQIESFFKHTKIEHYSRMWAYMSLSKSSVVQRVENGFERVLKKKYAFIWDSPSVRHETASNCDLMEIGTPFDLRGYGIATQKDSPFTEKLSLALLDLNDRGILYHLEGKWWRRPNCPDPRSSAKSKAIEIEVASGMFIVLLAGIVLSAIVCALEYFITKECRRRKAKGNNPEICNMQPNHNHVPCTVDESLAETNTMLTRTLSLSLGDSCGNSKWES
ncbi:hypothetical protein CHS0354_006615 [Potamilus streckersoni]|uniref:Glutamate receptor n=1 Tax=Potamilus streckersoni TaxID=2493646 RepID=A0AAE0SWS4_9BIVA|nr:hypothetical protein CHS0354_006615 [Potamilus streckersoni]